MLDEERDEENTTIRPPIIGVTPIMRSASCHPRTKPMIKPMGRTLAVRTAIDHEDEEHGYTQSDTHQQRMSRCAEQTLPFCPQWQL